MMSRILLSFVVVAASLLVVEGAVLRAQVPARQAANPAFAKVDDDPKLPRVLIYHRFNAWGRQREIPALPRKSFRELYR